MLKFSPCSLWDFAVCIYGTKDVQNACLSLQDRRDIDVNLLLFFIWSAKQGFGVLSSSELDLAIEVSVDWQTEIIKPLRQVRNVLKVRGVENAPCALLRKSVLENELDAERLELEILRKLLTRLPVAGQSNKQRAENALQNALNYMSRKMAVTELGCDDLNDITLICTAAFSDELKDN